MARGGRYRHLYERQFRTDGGRTRVEVSEPPAIPETEEPAGPLAVLSPLLPPRGGPDV
jgi:hypothetical protein